MFVFFIMKSEYLITSFSGAHSQAGDNLIIIIVF